MASLRRLPNSPYWIACFTLPDGRPTQRSTKTVDRGEAMRIALAYEDASKAVRAGRLVESQARRVIADVYELAHHEPLTLSTVQAFLNAWLKRKEAEIEEKSCQRYAIVVRQFIAFLGGRATHDLPRLKGAD